MIPLSGNNSYLPRSVIGGSVIELVVIDGVEPVSFVVAQDLFIIMIICINKTFKFSIINMFFPFSVN